MSYYRRLPDGLLVLEARPHHAEQLAALQIACFPTLADHERFKAEHFLKHMELFPAGQIIIVDPISGPTGCEDKVVAATATVRLNFDFGHATHTFADIIQGGWLTSHEPDGPWLYGTDISTLPTYRGRGLATALYAARQELVFRLGLEGQVTAGMIPGYGKVKATVSADQYYADVLAGACKDATLSTQIRVGFEPRGLLANYLNDPVCDNYAVLLVLPASRDVAGADRTHAADHIRLHTPIPGPASQALVARRMAAVPSGWGKATDLAIEQAEGSLVHDADGKTLIDLAGGIGMLAAGHCPPSVVEAIVAQAAGFPIGAVTGRAEIMDSAHLGGVGSTYGGGPLACAAAIATVEIIRQPEFLAHATHLGNVMREVMARWQQRWPILGEARGLGPMMVVELVADPVTKVPLSVADTLSIVKASIANGVVLIRAGLFSNCIRFLPPLTISEVQLREGLAAVERAIATFADRHAPPQPAYEPASPPKPPLPSAAPSNATPPATPPASSTKTRWPCSTPPSRR